MITLYFINKHFNPIRVLWLNSDTEELAAMLRPGQDYRQSANVGDRFVARDVTNNKILCSVTARSDAQIAIKEEIRRIDPEHLESPYINAIGALVGARAPQFGLQFEGKGDVVLVPHDEGLDLVKSWTLEAWIFRTGWDCEQTIIEKCEGAARDGGYCLKIGDSNRIQGGFYDGGDFIYVQGDTPLEAMRWYHVAVSFNDVTDELRCYLDGKPDGSCVRISRGTMSNRAVLQFDGINDYIAIPKIELSETAYSASFWFKTEEKCVGLLCADAGILSAGGHDRDVFLDEKGNLRAYLSPAETIGSTGLNFADGRWHHVVHTFGGAVGGQRLYADGVLLATGSQNSSGFGRQEGLNIGYSAAAMRPHFVGQMAEVSVWTVPLPESFIAAHWRMRLRGTEAGLQGLWRLDQGYGVSYADATANRLSASLEGLRQELTMTAVRLSGGFIDGGTIRLTHKSFSLSLWAKRDGAGGTQCLMAQGVTADKGLFFGFIDNRLTLRIGGQTVAATATEPDLAWHHYACQVDLQAKALILLRDGVMVVTAQAVPDYTSEGALLIGKTPWESGTLQAEVAELSLWEMPRGLAGACQDFEACPLGTEAGILALWSRPLHPDETPSQRKGLWNAARSRQHADFRGAVSAELKPRPHGIPVSAPRWNRYSELRLVPFDLMGKPCTAPLSIGGRSRDSEMSFSGTIDAVRIWCTVRTSDEISACWNQALTGSEAGLRAYFPCDEGSGQVITDQSSRGYLGTLGRADGTSRPAWIESTLLLMDGLRFDGVDDWISLPPMEADFSQGLTLEAWVYLEALQSGSRIIDLGNGPGRDNLILASVGTRPDLCLTVYREGRSYSLSASGVLRVKEWLHLAGTIDNVGAARLYVNGKEVATGSLQLPASVLRRQNYIGRSNWAADSYLKGCLDELRLWQTARSAEQLQAYMRRRLPAGDTRLLALFPCDEGSGAVIFDNTSHGLHGLLGGGEPRQQPAWMRQGERDQMGLRFDGVDDYVSVPAEVLSRRAAATIELWLSWEGRACTLLGTHNGMDQARLSIGADGRLEFCSRFGGPLAQSLAALCPGRWHHAAVVIEPQKTRIYLDGELDRSVVGDFSLAADLTGANAALGAAGDGRGAFFAGILDEIRIWNTSRTRIQLQANMNRRVSPDSPGLVAYYPIEDGTGVNLYDRSPSHYHGTLGGGGEAQRPHWLEASPVQFEGMKFNGAGDYLEIPSSDALSVCSGFSITAWIRPGMLLGRQTVVAKAQNEQECQFALSIDGETLRLDYERTGNNYSLSGGNLREGWNHIAATIAKRHLDTPVVRMDAEGRPEQQTVITASGAEMQCPVVDVQSLDAPEIRLYVNGLQVAYGTAPAATLPSTAPLTIGALCTEEKKQAFFYGVIDSVALHDAALSQAQVQDVQNRRLPDFAPGLLGYFRFPSELPIGAEVTDRAGRSAPGVRRYFERFSGGDNLLAPQGTVDLCSPDAVMVLRDPPVLSCLTIEMWISTPLPEGESGQSVLLEGGWLSKQGYSEAEQLGEFRIYASDGDLHASLPFGIDVRLTAAGTAGNRDMDGILHRLCPGWHHLAIILDPSCESSVVRAVLDGETLLDTILDRDRFASRNPRRKSQYQRGGYKRQSEEEEALWAPSFRVDRIGNSEQGGAQIGRLDEVRLWDHPRTEAQVRQLMRQRLLGSEAGLCGYWRFEEGSGFVTKDHTPRDRAAELRGEFRWLPLSDLHLSLAVFRPRNEMTALELRSGSDSRPNFPPPSWGAEALELVNLCTSSLTFFIEYQEIPEWISQDAVAGILRIDNGFTHLMVWMQADGCLAITCQDREKLRTLKSGAPLFPGRFTHVAVSWDWDDELCALYLNGVKHKAELTHGSYQENWQEDSDLRGSFQFQPELREWQGFDGTQHTFRLNEKLGQVGLFPRPLLAEEVAVWASKALFKETPGWDVLSQHSEPILAWLFEQAPLDLRPKAEPDESEDSERTPWIGWTDHSGMTLPFPETCLRLKNSDVTSVNRDGVSLGSSGRLHLPESDFSVEVWLCCHEFVGPKLLPVLYLSGGPEQRSLFLGIDGGRLAVRVGDRKFVSSFELAQDTWYHVALSLSMQGAELTLYVNGRPVHRVIGLGQNRFGGELGLGHTSDSAEDSQLGFCGQLCDVALWDRARTGQEIAQDYRKRLSPTEPGLIGYWRLDGTSGQYAMDSTVGCHHGILSGKACWVRRQGLTIVEGGTPQEPTVQDAEALAALSALPRPVLPETVATQGVIAPAPSSLQPGSMFVFCSSPGDAARAEVTVAAGVRVAVTEFSPSEESLSRLPAPFGSLARTLSEALATADGDLLNLSSDLLGDFDPLAALSELSPDFLKIREPRLKTIGSADGGDGTIAKTLGLRLSGKVQLFGMAPIEVEADFYKLEEEVQDDQGKASTQRKFGYMLKFHFPEPFGLRRLLGNVPLIGGLQFYKASPKYQSNPNHRLLGIIVTNDQVASIRLIPGLNFYGSLRLAETEDPVLRFISKLFHVDELQLHMVLAKSLIAADAVLGIDLEILPGKLWFREIGVGIKVITSPPQSEISVFQTLEVKIGGDRLRFTGQLAAQQGKGGNLAGSLSMEGAWHNPLGVQNLVIRDLAAQLAVKAEEPWLDQIGFTGRLQIGRASAMMAVLIDTNDSDKCVFIGDAKNVKLPDIVSTLCGPSTLPSELRDVLDRFELRRLKISIVPQAVYIGSFYFDEKGITIKVGVTLLGWSGDLYLRVDYNDGIQGYATLDPIDILGILELRESRDEKGLARTRLFHCAADCPERRPDNLCTQAGLCQVELYGKPCGRQLAPKAGPQLYVNLSRYRSPELYISGFASVLGISSDVFVRVQRSGLAADVRGALFGLFEARIQLRASLNLSHMYIKAELRNDFFARLREEAIKAIHSFAAEGERALDEAMADIRSAQGKVDRLLLDIENMRFQVKQEREALSRRLRQLQDELDGAQRSVNSLLEEIERTKEWYASLPAVNWPWSPSKARDWVWVGPKLAGLYIAYGVATAVLKVARLALEVADFLVLNLPLDLDPRLVALWAAHGVATAALNAAEGALRGTKALMRGFAWVAEQVVRLALGELFDIRYAMFEGEFSNAKSLMKVQVVAEIVFLRMNLRPEFTLDFSNISGTANALIRGLIAEHAV